MFLPCLLGLSEVHSNGFLSVGGSENTQVFGVCPWVSVPVLGDGFLHDLGDIEGSVLSLILDSQGSLGSVVLPQSTWFPDKFCVKGSVRTLLSHHAGKGTDGNFPYVGSVLTLRE